MSSFNRQQQYMNRVTCARQTVQKFRKLVSQIKSNQIKFIKQKDEMVTKTAK